jgi:small subunit ribosomal protein S13
MAEQKSQENKGQGAQKPVTPVASAGVKDNFRYFVRIANTDIDGNKTVYNALKSIKGVGFMFSNMVCNISGIEKGVKLGYLNDEQVKKLDEIITNPLKFNAPKWMLNKRKNYEDGKDYHFVTGDLNFSKDEDIKRMKKMKSYRGVRHSLGLPVRGQRTKSNFRKNKGKASLGVIKKAGAKSGKV